LVVSQDNFIHRAALCLVSLRFANLLALLTPPQRMRRELLAVFGGRMITLSATGHSSFSSCPVLLHHQYVSLRYRRPEYSLLVISSVAAWAGNETPRKWQGSALKLLS
jgi:hypothetical protein